MCPLQLIGSSADAGDDTCIGQLPKSVILRLSSFSFWSSLLLGSPSHHSFVTIDDPGLESYSVCHLHCNSLACFYSLLLLLLVDVISHAPAPQGRDTKEHRSPLWSALNTIIPLAAAYARRVFSYLLTYNSPFACSRRYTT